MNCRLIICLLLCALTFCLKVGAQGRGIRYVSGTMGETTFAGRIVDSLTKAPLPSAVISVVSKDHASKERSVRNYVADKKGNFRFTCVSYDESRMEVSVLGYKPHVVHLIVECMGDEIQELGLIRLSQSSQEIDEVVVKARIQMYKMKGDTIIYLPSAVNTMKDDAALEILRRMPGVEVDDEGGVKILGQLVKRTYVNEKLLFGDDPKTALQQLNADEVASIEAYDEVDEADSVINGANARKRKVLNVVTFKDFTQTYTAKARGEMGTDFQENMDGKRPVRYLGSAEAGFYSEALQLSAEGQSNNLERSYKSMRESDARVSVSGKANKKHRYRANYSYSGDNRVRINASGYDYFSTDYFTTQRSESSGSDESRSDRHTLSTSYGYIGERATLSTSLNAGFSNENSLMRSLSSTVRDGEAVSATDMMSKSRRDSRSLSGNTHGSWRFENGSDINAGAQFSLNNNESRGLRLERRTVDGVETPLGWDSYAPVPDNSARGNVGYGLNFEKAGSLSFDSDVSYAGSAERLLYTDRQTGERDWARSEDAFDKTIAWEIGPTYNLPGKNLDWLFSASLKYKLENRVYEDAKVGATDRRNYHFLDGYLSYSYNKPKKNLSVSFSSSSMSVLARDFTSRIQDSNPLYVSTGNASLVPSKHYSLMFNSNFLGENASYGFSTSLGAQVNPIMQRSRFFKEETVLPEYDNYRMPAGSTLTTPENGAAFLRFNVTANYKVRIAPLALFLDMRADYGFSNPEVEQYGRMERSGDHRGGLNVELTTNFSSKFRIKASNRVGVNYQKRFGNTSHEFQNTVIADVQWDILDNLCFNAVYVGGFRWTSGGIEVPDSHLLNLSLGWRVLKERGRIAFNAYDVLDKFSPISIRQTVEYISREVSYVGANYFTLSFEYKFNNRRAAK